MGLRSAGGSSPREPFLHWPDSSLRGGIGAVLTLRNLRQGLGELRSTTSGKFWFRFLRRIYSGYLIHRLFTDLEQRLY